ncbi:two-component system, NtrC family, C4-dicarboxylate transport sensor histidine kinase DctB [Formivibrio citricus]|uniref:C4-dicarboxylate transport sensor protein DctB n=1 Tax=Formivibrio citricus TaxID=83765 RepID=A0A1I5BWQ4_9NEIS|nr:ATP-binding protein [Formivibrio citricus]SFN79075.1 two-component system, NtrC family, C4-dicarboxylate transport sensor histidine kinase DctB [Formivibrio citricus]
MQTAPNSGRDSPSRPDWIRQVRISVLSVLALLLTAASGWHVYRLTFEDMLEEIQSQAHYRLETYASSLEREIDKYANFPYVVGLDAQLKEYLADTKNPELKLRSNRFLERLNRRVGSLALFLLDNSGTVVASSNWNRKDSFVGRDLSYRPYYQNVGIDRVERFYGIGTTNNEPGYFLSTAVHDGSRIIGTAVVKVSLEQLEKSWSSAESPALLSEGHGVVVLSSVPAWKYATLKPLDEATRHQIIVSQQYNGYALAPLGMKVRRVLNDGSSIVSLPAVGRNDANHLFSTDGLFLTQTRMMSGTPWHLTVFSDLKKADDQAKIRATLAVLITALMLGMGLVFMWRQRHMREILQAREALQRANDELERKVVERTADLSAANTRLQQEVEERSRAEQVLREAQDGLVQASKLAVIGQLSAGLAHELNQPLAALSTLSGNAVKFLARGNVEMASSNLARIGPLVERMGLMTGQLKGFARKSSGEARLVVLSRSVDNALFLQEQRLLRGRVSVKIDFPEKELRVWCDPNRLEQVLVNLIGNAIDAMEHAAEPRIELQASESEGMARLQVRDHGPGLSEEILAHLFEPFFTTKAPGVGLGLGLPISAGIVRDFGGELTAWNAPDGGAIFALTIPISKESERNAAPA